MGVCLRWVVALRPEAQAVIDRYRLVQSKEPGALYPIFCSAEGDIELIISGIGRSNAAGASGYLAGRGGAGASACGWINFGIAGSGELNYGEAFLASKLESDGESQSWYPPAVWPRRVDLPRRVIRTVDSPVTEYSEVGSLVEMEAAGYYPVALRATSSELCQVLKVVSDDPGHDIADINKSQVTSLCHSGLDQADAWITAFRDLVEEEQRRLSDPPGYLEWSESLRLSVTERHQLRRLLQQWQALNPEERSSPQLDGLDTSNGKACLKALRAMISQLRGA